MPFPHIAEVEDTTSFAMLGAYGASYVSMAAAEAYQASMPVTVYRP